MAADVAVLIYCYQQWRCLATDVIYWYQQPYFLAADVIYWYQQRYSLAVDVADGPNLPYNMLAV